MDLWYSPGEMNRVQELITRWTQLGIFIRRVELEEQLYSLLLVLVYKYEYLVQWLEQWTTNLEYEMRYALEEFWFNNCTSEGVGDRVECYGLADVDTHPQCFNMLWHLDRDPTELRNYRDQNNRIDPLQPSPQGKVMSCCRLTKPDKDTRGRQYLNNSWKNEWG